MEDNSFLTEILILVFLIVCSAIFSASETALTSLNAFKRKKIINENKEKAYFLEKLYDRPGKMLTTILVGNNIVNILASIIATLVFIKFLTGLGIISKAIITTITTVTMTIILLIFGEISPKTFAIKNAEKMGLILSRPIYYLSIIFAPVIEVLNWVSKLIIKVTGGQALAKGSLVSQEEIKILINMGLEEGILEEEEEKMLTSIIEFGDIIVREVMTPRPSIMAVDSTSSVRKIVNLINHHGHSRIPVFNDRIDNIIGFVYAKDLLSVTEEYMDSPSYVKSLLRDPYFVPETKKIDELLKEMRKDKRHIAMVVDEYGGVSGLVTIEDVIEEIVGEIHDEYDKKEEKMLVEIGENTYLVSGMMNVGDFNKKLGTSIPEEEDYDSIAGFVVHVLGEIPNKGDVYEDDYFKFVVLDVIKRRITKLKLEIKNKGEEEENDD